MFATDCTQSLLNQKHTIVATEEERYSSETAVLLHLYNDWK